MVGGAPRWAGGSTEGGGAPQWTSLAVCTQPCHHTGPDSHLSLLGNHILHMVLCEPHVAELPGPALLDGWAPLDK